MADTRHAIRNRDARKATAISERILADARHAVGNRDARQVIAILERRIIDARHTISIRRHGRNHNIQIPTTSYSADITGAVAV